MNERTWIELPAERPTVGAFAHGLLLCLFLLFFFHHLQVVWFFR